MNFLSIVKIALSPFPQGAVFNQILAEVESAEMKRRIEILENPLARFGEDAKPLCHLLYDALKTQSTQLSNKVSWSEQLEPYIKTLRRFEAQGMVGGAPALGRPNEFLMGIGVTPEFSVYLALISDDGELCKELSAYLDGLEPGKGVNGREIQGYIPLPLPVIDAFLSVYEKQGQGLKSREIGASYYVAK
jgi:hypothetical protein